MKYDSFHPKWNVTFNIIPPFQSVWDVIVMIAKEQRSHLTASSRCVFSSDVMSAGATSSLASLFSMVDRKFFPF